MWNEAQTATVHIKSKLDKANAEIREKTNELDKAEEMAHRKVRDRKEAEEEARRKVKEWRAAEALARQKAIEHAKAETAARLKEGEWSSVEAAARRIVEKRTEAKATARQQAKKSKELILQDLKRNPLTSRELATIVKIEHEQVITLLKQLLRANQIEFTWSQRSPYTFCYQIRKRPNARPSSSPATPTKKLSSSRRSGCLWLLGPLGLLALLAQSVQ